MLFIFGTYCSVQTSSTATVRHRETHKTRFRCSTEANRRKAIRGTNKPLVHSCRTGLTITCIAQEQEGQYLATIRLRTLHRRRPVTEPSHPGGDDGCASSLVSQEHSVRTIHRPTQNKYNILALLARTYEDARELKSKESALTLG